MSNSLFLDIDAINESVASNFEIDEDNVLDSTYFLAEAAITDQPVLINEDVLALEGSDDVEALAEAKARNFKTTRHIVVKTKNQKINRLSQQLAMEAAKQAHDGDYERYEKHRKLEVILRKKIEKKYMARAKAMARKIATSGVNPLKKSSSSAPNKK